MQSDDGEAQAEEEAEALRLQREQAGQLAAEDFDDAHLFPDDPRGGAAEGDHRGSDDEDEDGQREPTLGAAAAAHVRTDMISCSNLSFPLLRTATSSRVHAKWFDMMICPAGCASIGICRIICRALLPWTCHR